MDTITNDIGTIRVGQPVSIPGEPGAWIVQAIHPAEGRRAAGVSVHAFQDADILRSCWVAQAVPVTEQHPVAGTAYLAPNGQVWRLAGYSTFNFITEQHEATPDWRVQLPSGGSYTPGRHGDDRLPEGATLIYAPEVPA